MIRGVRFQIPNEHGDFLHRITAGIKAEEYTWFISDDQVFLSDSKGFLFGDRVYSGTDFKEIIAKHPHYICCVALAAVTPGQEYETVKNYEEFLHSSCQILILCSDSVFVDVYCRDAAAIDMMVDHAKQQGFTHIETITEENDVYKEFSL